MAIHGFRYNPVGMRQMLQSDGMVAEMVRRAELIEAECIATAPFDPSSDDGTHYKEAFAVSATKRGGIRKDRAEAKVSNDDPAAYFIEYGTGDTPEFRTMTHAIDAARR